MIECIPINDTENHSKGGMCLCYPNIYFENTEMIVVHNAFDGRHLLEQANDILNIKNPPDKWEIIQH